MIITALLNFIAFLMQPFIFLLPEIESLPSGLNSAIDWGLNGISGIQYFVPFIDDMINILIAVSFIEITLMGFYIFNFIINKIRGSG